MGELVSKGYIQKEGNLLAIIGNALFVPLDKCDLYIWADDDCNQDGYAYPPGISL